MGCDDYNHYKAWPLDRLGGRGHPQWGLQIWRVEAATLKSAGHVQG